MKCISLFALTTVMKMLWHCGGVGEWGLVSDTTASSMAILISFSLARIKELLEHSPDEAFQFLRAECHSSASAPGPVGNGYGYGNGNGSQLVKINFICLKRCSSLRRYATHSVMKAMCHLLFQFLI